MKELKKITVIGIGLLGGSLTLSILRSFSGIKVVGFSHRSSTRQKARQLALASEICDTLPQSVADADIVILSTPVCTFEEIFGQIADYLKPGCIVTDVGSTKACIHRWAAKKLPSSAYYVGSHPIAGSEQRGLEFARDDLFDGALCILTTVKSTNLQAVDTLADFWNALGCRIVKMTPAVHDKVYANVSHIPHITAAALVNASSSEFLKFAGKGFIDTTRISSGPANIWADILVTNAENCAKGIDSVTEELNKIKKAVLSGDIKLIEKLLSKAGKKRAAMINQKIQQKEILS